MRRPKSNEAAYFLTALIVNCSFKFWVVSEAGCYLGEQRKEGALEFVLSTPLTVREILHGQWLALRRQFAEPLLTVLAVETIFLAASLQRKSFAQNPINPVLWVAAMLMLVADTVALSWTAMWSALTVKTPNQITALLKASPDISNLFVGTQADICRKRTSANKTLAAL